MRYSLYRKAQDQEKVTKPNRKQKIPSKTTKKQVKDYSLHWLSDIWWLWGPRWMWVSWERKTKKQLKVLGGAEKLLRFIHPGVMISRKTWPFAECWQQPKPHIGPVLRSFPDGWKWRFFFRLVQKFKNFATWQHKLYNALSLLFF